MGELGPYYIRCKKWGVIHIWVKGMERRNKALPIQSGCILHPLCTLFQMNTQGARQWTVKALGAYKSKELIESARARRSVSWPCASLPHARPCQGNSVLSCSTLSFWAILSVHFAYLPLLVLLFALLVGRLLHRAAYIPAGLTAIPFLASQLRQYSSVLSSAVVDLLGSHVKLCSIIFS